MRKYLFSGGILAAAFGLIGLVASTLKGPRTVKLALAWATWAIGAVTAVLSVREDAAEADEYYARKEAERDSRRR
ncbi:MAG TPA: hypothetical protein VK139_02040 [Microbacteriaceae bacterium]|nr:hypothetical protein [Microbacteriaceae bacterium]